MEIIMAKNIGFCFGVKRAYELSLETLKNKNGDCQMLGNLVHNEKVIEDLKKKGLKFVSLPEEVEKGTVIIRAHGIDDKTFEELKSKDLEIVDATCPLVKKAQEFARTLKKEGRSVVIIGEKNHPEVKAINGAINNEGIVIESDKEVEKIPENQPIGVVIQTTQDAKKTRVFLDFLRKRFKDIKICETFCYAVGKRQEEVRSLSAETDIVLVVGSKNSANTQRLIEIVSDEGGKVYGVEDKESVDRNWFYKGVKVGVISGTSAPEWLIEEVMEELNKIKNEF